VIEHSDGILAGIAGGGDKFIQDANFLELCCLLVAGSRLLQQLLLARENSCMTSLLDPPLCGSTVPWVTLLVMQLPCQSKVFRAAIRGRNH
jgi:hypothetical protein